MLFQNLEAKSDPRALADTAASPFHTDRTHTDFQTKPGEGKGLVQNSCILPLPWSQMISLGFGVARAVPTKKKKKKEG